MKIIVYAICKNEEKNIDLWYNSMQEADDIYVLDTGSTDRSVELLSKKNKVNVKQEIINPWRFDIARNKSLEMVPDDVDICVCTDIDERFLPGWRKEIEKVWTKETTRGKYQYNWSHNDDGTPGLSFYLDKIHSRKGYKWEHPVHEVLVNDIPEKTVIIDITLNHYQDREKSREMYLPILEDAVKENPFNGRDVYCLATEYRGHHRYDEAIMTYHKYLKIKESTWNQERSSAMRKMADCYKKKGFIEEALLWLNYAKEETPNIREVYYDLGLIYINIEDYENAKENLTKALEITTKNPEYINEMEAWNGSIYHLAAIAEYYTGDYALAHLHIKEAKKFFPKDKNIARDFKLIEKIYKQK